jgi:hypothetical protein
MNKAGLALLSNCSMEHMAFPKTTFKTTMFKLQGQASLSGTESGVLPGLQNPDIFVNMNVPNMNVPKGSVHSKEFSIQNEQEFPALPTATQPREEQLNSSDMQQNVQVCLRIKVFTFIDLVGIGTY